jgi:putative transposase
MAVFTTVGSHEEVTIYRDPDCRDIKGSRKRIADGRLVQKHGGNRAIFYKWRSKYGGFEASDLKRVKELEQQLSEYKTMVAELTHDNRALKNLI